MLSGGTAAIGLDDLGLPAGSFRAIAEAVSSNGDVIAGWSKAPGGVHAGFIWTSGGGFVNVGDLPGGEIQSPATNISGNSPAHRG